MTFRWYANNQSDSAVVFIHGILSDGFDAWYEQNENVFWPRLISNSPTLSDIDIVSISYPTNIFLRDYGPEEICADIKTRFEAHNIFKKRKIIFVCHSMGGVLCRRFILKYQEMFIMQEILIGLYLVASPTKGSIYANILGIPSRILGFEQGELLRKKALFLKSLHNDFLKELSLKNLNLIGREIVEHKFYYKLPIIWNVVSKSSAVNYFEDPLVIPKSNHSSIAKPISPNDSQHVALVGLIHNVLKSHFTNYERRDANLKRTDLINILRNDLKSLILNFKLDSVTNISFDTLKEKSIIELFIDIKDKINKLLLFTNNQYPIYIRLNNLLKIIEDLCLFIASENISSKEESLLSISHDSDLSEIDFGILLMDNQKITEAAYSTKFYLNWNKLVNQLADKCTLCVEKVAEVSEDVFKRES